MNTSIKLSEITARARGRLQGHYGQALLITISYFIFMLFLETVAELFNHDTSVLAFSIGIIASLVISAICIKYKISMVAYFLDIAVGKKPASSNVYNSFIKEGGGKSGLAISLAVFQQICYLPAYIIVYMFDSSKITYSIMLLIALILGALIFWIIDIRLLPAYYLVSDIPNISSAKAMVTGLWLSRNQFFKILLLKLYFIPLIILGVLSCGIGLLYVYPYMYTSEASLYLQLCKIKETDDEQ